MPTTIDSDFGPIDVDESPPQRRQRPVGVAGWHDFEIVNKQPHGRAAEVYMDGQLLRGVTRVRTKIDVMGVNKVVLTFNAGSLNAPDPAPTPPDPPRVGDQPEG